MADGLNFPYFFFHVNTNGKRVNPCHLSLRNIKLSELQLFGNQSRERTTLRFHMRISPWPITKCTANESIIESIMTIISLILFSLFLINIQVYSHIHIYVWIYVCIYVSQEFVKRIVNI